jgi:hypothetical protein
MSRPLPGHEITLLKVVLYLLWIPFPVTVIFTALAIVEFLFYFFFIVLFRVPSPGPLPIRGPWAVVCVLHTTAVIWLSFVVDRQKREMGGGDWDE